MHVNMGWNPSGYFSILNTMLERTAGEFLPFPPPAPRLLFRMAVRRRRWRKREKGRELDTTVLHAIFEAWT
jgi:hypothetical protein